MVSPNGELMAIIDSFGQVTVHNEMGMKQGPTQMFPSQQDAEDAYTYREWRLFTKVDASVFSNPEHQRADENKGENGEFSEPTVVDRKKKWAPTDGKAGDPASLVPGTPGTCCPDVMP